MTPITQDDVNYVKEELRKNIVTNWWDGCDGNQYLAILAKPTKLFPCYELFARFQVMNTAKRILDALKRWKEQREC